jgi:phosphomannomutase
MKIAFMTTLKQLSTEQNVAFGTSGVRALVEDLTPRLCYAYTQAFLQQVCPSSTSVAIGIDLRPSSADIACTMVKAAEDLGLSIVYCGALPTPALAYYSMQNDMPCIMVTGSHIPFDRNGFKLYTPKGEITKDDEQSIQHAILGNDLDEYRSQCLPSIDLTAITLYQKRYTDLFPATVLQGKRIGLYEHSSVGRDVIKSLLQQLGAEVISLERTDTFVPIDTEAVSEADQQKAFAWSKEWALDAIVSTDGDADRPLISDENGQWLRGDVVGILVARFLGVTHVAVPVNANTALELANPDMVTQRTRIGSPYVIEAMQTLADQAQSAKIAGYEANGGFLVGSHMSCKLGVLLALPTRDAVLPILAVLYQAFKEALPISQLVVALPARYTYSDRIQSVPTALSQTFITKLKHDSQQVHAFLHATGVGTVQIERLDETDGLRIYLSNQDIVHLRPSGNAPELRCYAESAVMERSKQIVEKALAYVQRVLV